MLAMPVGKYQTFNTLYIPLLLATTVPVLQFILMPPFTVLMPFRYFPLLNTVIVEQPSRYA